MSFADEFAVVDAIAVSNHETRGVDAFALAVIKAERQMRKLFTHMVFQYPCFTTGEVTAMRKALGAKPAYYFEGFERGVDALARRPVSELIGAEYVSLRATLDEAIGIRNKVFHGQLTLKYLGREELLEFVSALRRWCHGLAIAGLEEVGYDGFQRNSFRKIKPNIAASYRMRIVDLEGYERLLKAYVARPSGGKKWNAPVEPVNPPEK